MADQRDAEEAHRAAFGVDVDSDVDSDDFYDAADAHRERFGFSISCTRMVNKIRNNDPALKHLSMMFHHAEHFSDLAWELLGRYVAANDQLVSMNLSCAKMSLLFKHLTGSTSIKRMELSHNDFGLSGIQSVVPFLEGTRNLTAFIYDSTDTKLDTESFGLVICALEGSPIQELKWGGCSNLDDITVLGQHTLPLLTKLTLCCNRIHTIPSLEDYIHLEVLDLSSNENIGAEGCRSIAMLLRKEGTSLRVLNLSANKVGDREAEILADSLKENTTLEVLEFENVEGFSLFGEAGCKAFLKLLNGIESIEATAKSNHTLTLLRLPYLRDNTPEISEMKSYIYKAVSINKRHVPHKAARKKILESQLNTIRRKQLCRLLDVDFNYGTLLEGIDGIYTPDILAMAREICDSYCNCNASFCSEVDRGDIPFTELYNMMKLLAPEFTSLINRRGLLEDTIRRNKVQITALATEHTRHTEVYKKHTEDYARQTAQFLQQTTAITAENFGLNKRLLSMGFGEKEGAKAVGQESRVLVGKTKKRRRSASF